MAEARVDQSIAIITPPVAHWREFKRLRLDALRSDPQAFGQSLAVVEDFPDKLWQERLRDVAGGRSWLLVAETGGRWVGMVGAYRTSEQEQSGGATVYGTFVEPDVRGRGVGQLLMGALLDQLAAVDGIAWATLKVNREQTAAVKLYERSGFEIVGEETELLGTGLHQPVFLMRRSLRNRGV
jgi:ribosomal protein S18 acetylase RimI-like enzyme